MDRYDIMVVYLVCTYYYDSKGGDGGDSIIIQADGKLV